MLALALILATFHPGNLAPGVSMRLERTESTRVTFTVRDRGSSAASAIDRQTIESLPQMGRSLHDFVLRGVSEVQPQGWSEASQMLGDNTTAKIGLAHAMNLAARAANDPVRYSVPGRPLPPGTFQERDYGLRAFDLNVEGLGGPIVVARYWFPERQPLAETPVYGSGYRLPDGSMRNWSYRGGGWRLETPDGTFETESTPPALSVDRTGIDLNDVSFRIRNNTDDPVSGTVLPGQVLVPSDPQTQRMVTTRGADFTVPGSGEVQLQIPVACLDMGKKQPNAETVFRAVPNNDAVLANLVNLTQDAAIIGPWNQAAFWIHTDAASLEQINEHLGRGISPLQYQQAAAQVAMHGGLDPLDGRFSQVWQSLGEPRSILTGMQDAAGQTSVFAASLGSMEGAAALKQGAQQLFSQFGGVTFTPAQRASLAKTVESLNQSGDVDLQTISLRIIREFLRDNLPSEAQATLEFARCSPDDSIRKLAWGTVEPPPPSSLFGWVTCLNMAEEIVDRAVRATRAPEEPAEPAFSASFQKVPESVAPGDSVTLSIATQEGSPLAVSYGVRTGPGEAVRNIANGKGAFEHSWTADVQAPAVVQLTAEVVSTEGQIARTTVPVHVRPTIAANVRSEIADALRRAREAKAREDRARAEAERKRQEYERIVSSVREHWAELQALQAADRDLLDGLEAKYRQPIEDLIKRNQALTGGSPVVAGNVDKAAEDAKKAADDCDKELAELRQQKADAEKQRDDLRNKLNQLLNQINAIYQAAGFTGGSGFHSDGTAWFGWVNEGAGLPRPQEQQVTNLQQQMRAANRQMRAANKRIADLDAKIKAKEEECAKLKKRNEEAQQAKANKDEAAANDAQIGKAWDDIAGKLEGVGDLLDGVEGGSGLSGDANRLRGSMPTDQAGWDRFWEQLRGLVERKKRLEAELERKIRDEQQRGRAARDARDQAQDDADDAARDGSTATAEAGALQQEAERQKQEAAAAGTQPPQPTAPVENPCMKKFAQWLAKYQDKMSQSQLDKLKEMMKGAAESAQVPGVAVGDAIAGGAKALASGAGNAAVGLNALASGFLSLGAGLFYAYAQSEIARALGPLGSKIRLARIAGLLLGSREKCGEVGEGGVTGRGSESFFYFRVGNQLIVFRGGESGVEFVGVGPAGAPTR